MRSRYPALFLILALLASPISAAELAPELERIKKDIFFLAGEECEGRGLETQGILKAGEYIADSFRQSGLKSAFADGSFFQPFDIQGASRLGTPNALSFANGDTTLDLKYGTDFTPTAMSASGKRRAAVVFAGYGITADQPKFDEYAGIEAKGKFVIVLRRAPKYGKKDSPFSPDSPHPSLIGKVENAVKHGAAGVIFVNDIGEKGDTLMPFGYARGPSADVPVLHIKRELAAKLLGLDDLTAVEKDLDEMKPQSRDLKGWTVSAEVTLTKTVIPTRNVVAISEGSGPLADETIVVGAHYDHLGRGEPGTLGGADAKSKVHYGADDNGSGTTGLLELARRVGAIKNRIGRRIVFVAFSGEERGLFGSIHYCKKPPFPLEKTVFMVNMDMIGRVVPVDDDSQLAKYGGVAGAAVGAIQPNAIVKRDRLVVYGTGTAEGLNDLVTAANRKTDFKMIRLPGGTGPSDHDSFYRKKVPVVFFFTGTHKDYHRPTDTPDKINLDGLRKVVDVAEILANHYATATDRPKYLVTSGGWSDPTEDRPRVTRPAMPKLGIMPGNYEATDGGVLVEELSPGGAAEKGGVKAKDVVIEIAGKPIKDINTYMAAMAAQKAGVEIEVKVLRNDKKMTLKLVPLP